MVRSNAVKHNKTLQKYFSDTKSKASYIVADEYINKIAQTAMDNKVELPNNFDTAPERVTDAFEQLDKDAGYTIYDKKNSCININDSDNLTDEEKYAILAAYTSNVNYNSFAAEVEYHSDALVNWKRILPFGWYDRAIRADMAFGEENDGIADMYDPYFDLDSKIVKKQTKEHGEK